MAFSFKTQTKIFESLKVYLTKITTTITDLNVGSVIGSFFYAISNAIADLYITIQNVYLSIFIASAEGTDLDNRIADFTLVRRLATRSSGYVTFYKTTNSAADIIIPAGTRVKTIVTNLIQGVEFQTTLEGILPSTISNEQYYFKVNTDNYDFITRNVYDIISITGTVGGYSGYTFIKDVDYSLDSSSEINSKIVWIGQKPDDLTYFYVSYYPLSVDIPIQALGSGSFGNVSPQSITNCPSRPSGIDGVINYEQISGGTDDETDEELRARVPLYLGSLSKATKNAIRAAALATDGVKNATVVEYTPPNGYITVFIDDGNGSAPPALIRAVKDTIQGTINGLENDTSTGIIAAGIGINVTAPVIKFITIVVTVTTLVGIDQSQLINDIELDVSQWLTSSKPGQQVIRAELIRIIKAVNGVYNIDLDTLFINGLTSGDVIIAESETAKLASINVRVKI